MSEEEFRSLFMQIVESQKLGATVAERLLSCILEILFDETRDPG